MRLVSVAERVIIPPRLGPIGGYNHSEEQHVGVELDDGTTVDTGIVIGSFGSSDYSSCYSSHDHAELFPSRDGWIIRVINESSDVGGGPIDVKVTATYASSDGKSWRKLEGAAEATGERLSRLG